MCDMMVDGDLMVTCKLALLPAHMTFTKDR